MKLTLAYNWTDAEGNAHDAGKTVTVDDEVGRELVFTGTAAKAESGTKPSGTGRSTPKTAKDKADEAAPTEPAAS